MDVLAVKGRDEARVQKAQQFDRDLVSPPLVLPDLVVVLIDVAERRHNLLKFNGAFPRILGRRLEQVEKRLIPRGETQVSESAEQLSPRPDGSSPQGSGL